MTYTMEQYEESAQAIRARLKGFVPKVAMVLGSGLGFLGDQVEDPIAIDYHDIPHFKASTAPGHKGRLVCGMLDGQRVAVMQGRMHHYEGYSYEEVSYAVRVLRLLGCDTLVVTNAAGCVRQDWHAGELMLITDQIKMFSPSPLRGENLPQFGPRFPDASHLYSPRLQQLARDAARELGLTLRGWDGVRYLYFDANNARVVAESSDTTVRSDPTFTVLEDCGCPAVLVEEGFITNASDRAALCTDSACEQAAELYYQCIIDFFE